MLTTREAAAYLAGQGYTVGRRWHGGRGPISARTLRKWCERDQGKVASERRLPGAIKVGEGNRAIWKIPQQALDDLINTEERQMNQIFVRFPWEGNNQSPTILIDGHPMIASFHISAIKPRLYVSVRRGVDRADVMARLPLATTEARLELNEVMFSLVSNQMAEVLVESFGIPQTAADQIAGMFSQASQSHEDHERLGDQGRSY
jgi:hypothetical protein